MGMTDTLIKVENVSKKFCRSLKRSLQYGIQDLGNELIGRRYGGNGELREDEFWAVRNVSFEVKRGECLGLIGRNGAGKTTLLRMLNGLIKPDKGRIEMRGRVGALIALGAGFNPVLTGRENIYVNASVFGLKKRQIDDKLDEIIDFAEISEFIDAPVQTYSSGMQVRLGFSIASTLTPDILILDEILAVGDANFRSKCYRRIGECQSDSAVILVTHNMEQLARISNKAILLTRGQIAHFGTTDHAIALYNQTSIVNRASYQRNAFCNCYPPVLSIVFHSYSFFIEQGADVTLSATIEADRNESDCWVRVVLFNESGGFSADVDIKHNPIHIEIGHSIITISLESLRLRAGSYELGINIFSLRGQILLWSYKEVSMTVTSQSHIGNADYQLKASAVIRRIDTVP